MNVPLNILLAEDERSVAFSICFALKPDGHRMEMVTDGEQAIAEITGKPAAFDLLITDHSMPSMNGVELVRRLREAGFRGKILVLSAHLSPDNRAAYEALGVDGMLSKPFDLFQLRDLIRKIVLSEAPPVWQQAIRLRRAHGTVPLAQIGTERGRLAKTTVSPALLVCSDSASNSPPGKC